MELSEIKRELQNHKGINYLRRQNYPLITYRCGTDFQNAWGAKGGKS